MVTLECKQTLLLLIMAAIISTSSKATSRAQPRPTGRKVILLMLDGWRWDYPDFPGLTGFPRLANVGVRARYLIPEYPTNTFPNLYSLETGLHVESHGLIDNYTYDNKTKKLFSFNGDHYEDPLFWDGAEPFWITAKKQGIRTHLYYWVGCGITIRGMKADHCVRYPYWTVGHKPFLQRIDESLDLIEQNQTDFVGLYSDLTDHKGHIYGVYSEQHNATIRHLDEALNRLMDGLQTRNLTDTVDVILAADHGMLNTVRDKLIYLVDYVSYWKWFISMTETVTVSAQCSLVFLWPEREEQILTIYGLFLNKHPHMRVFLKQHYSDVFNWHFKDNEKTPPILLAADPGWCIVRPFDFFIPSGTHGYDNNHPDMRATFMAYGPDFKKNYLAEPINMVDIYQIYTKILGMDPKPHNGTWSHVSEMMTW